MDITPLIDPGQQVIQSYNETGFRINGTFFDHPVIVFPDKTEHWDVTHSVTEFALSDFELLQAQNIVPEVILVGCGHKTILPAPLLRKQCKESGLSIDWMDTGAACRTYNVLMAEGRRVAAALLPVKSR